MKVKSKNKVKKAAPESASDGEILHLPLENITDHPKLPNRKLKADHVADLKKSIRSNGLDIPLAVWNGGEDGLMIEIEEEDGSKTTIPATCLVFGAHRREALRELQQEEPGWFKKHFPNGVPAIMRTGDLKDQIAAQLRENLDRDNPEPSEFLPQFRRLAKTMKPSEIARAIGKTKGYVSRLLDVERQLGKTAMKKLEKGKLGIKDTMEAAEEVKRSKKAGKPISPKKALAKAEKKAKSRKGNRRAPRRVTARSLYTRYHAMPNMGTAKKLAVAEGIIAYLAEETDDLPTQVQTAAEQE